MHPTPTPAARFWPAPAVRRVAAGALVVFSFVTCGSEERAGDAGGTAQEVHGSAQATGGAAPVEQPLTRAPYDWLIEGGTVVDGTGDGPRRADVLVDEGRIAWVGIVDPDTIDAESVYDATGLVVAPGFIDLHGHGDPVERGGFENLLAMGVTTVVLGQDGSSPAARALAAQLEAVDSIGPGVNVGYMVGHGTVRQEAGVGFTASDPAGVARMAELVSEALAAGALGLSTGLEYNPGGHADARELAGVASVVAAHGAVVSSHVRSEDADQVEASIEELLEQGRASGAAVHVSHMKVVLGSDTTLARRILDRMERARAEGLRVSGDVYPYLASFTGISILFPDWALGPNDYAAAVRERRSELAAHLRARVTARNGPEAMLFGSGPWRGRTLAEAAAAEGRPFEELLVELGPGGASAAYFVMDERVLRTFLTDPWVAVASDGSPTMSHPRGYGSFARIVRRYVVEEGLLSIEEAIRKMTSLPASIVGLDDPGRVALPRGALRAGWAADVVVFDPERFQDRATFEEPHLLASGMNAVWVNGAPAWRDGSAVGGSGHGRAIRARDPAPR